MPQCSAHLTANKWFGLDPMDAADAIGVTFKGQTYVWTGKRGLATDGDGREVVKARARSTTTRDEIDVVQWYVPADPSMRLCAPLDVHLIYPPTADELPQWRAGLGWSDFR